LWLLAGMLAMGSLLMLASTFTAHICLAVNINYDQPVAVIQKHLETLRKPRIRYIQ
jgi:hypothetical protein